MPYHKPRALIFIDFSGFYCNFRTSINVPISELNISPEISTTVWKKPGLSLVEMELILLIPRLANIYI